MKKISFLILSFFLVCNFCPADVYNYPENLDIITKQLPELDSIKCKFKQEKQLKNIQKPLVSGGDFEFKKNDGVYFSTTYPVQTKTDYTGKNYKQINDIVNAISSKKYSKLEKEFNFYFESTGKVWTLGLKPKKGSSAVNYISSVTISGEDYIKQITILQTNGNKTLLWFTK